MGGEMAFGGWIFTYADGATGSQTTARLVNSAFWAGIVVGRLVAIPLAVRFSPRAMLTVDLVGTVASLALILLFPGSVPALWIGTIGFGFFVASMIPSSFNLAERRMPITGQVSAAFLVGGSLGTMTLPWLVGQLFGPWGPLAVVYVALAAMLAAAAVFAAIVRGRREPVAADVAQPPAHAAAG
jgi:FHS family Na+ dependent glucose MFS transporter 1